MEEENGGNCEDWVSNDIIENCEFKFVTSCEKVGLDGEQCSL